MRPLASFLISPSVDLSKLAEQRQRDMPYLIQYFVNRSGRDAASCADLMSYLLFTSATRVLSPRLVTTMPASESMRSRVFSILLMIDREKPRASAVGTVKRADAQARWQTSCLPRPGSAGNSSGKISSVSRESNRQLRSILEVPGFHRNNCGRVTGNSSLIS